MLNKFTNGDPELVARLNELIAIARKVENISGGGEIKVHHTSGGIVISSERRRSGGGTGSEIYKAFVKTDAGASDEVTCYLNTDATGDEITVSFEDMISGDTVLTNAFPPIVDGLLIPVWNDAGTWRPIAPVGVIERCT